MNQMIRKVVLILGLGLTGVCAASAGVQVGFSAGTRGVDGFYLSLGNYYGVSQNQLVVLRDNRVSDEEMAVVLAISRGAHVSPIQVIRLHQKGLPWFSIAARFNLGPSVFYLPVNRGGYYSRVPVRYSDRDVINAVNNRFLSERYGCKVEEIAQWRSRGDRYRDIHQRLESRVQARVPEQRNNRSDWDRRDRQNRNDRDFDRDHRDR
jgi:hypothetical protein